MIRVIIKLALAAMLLLCLAPMPYVYFQFVKLVGCTGFAYLAYDAFKRDVPPLLYMWGAAAVLLNPIVKFHLGRSTWNVVDVILAVMLLLSFPVERYWRTGASGDRP